MWVERYRLAQEYLDARAPLAALDTLKPVETEVAEVASGQLLLARAYYHSAQLNRARRALERVIELDPVDDYAHFAMGRVFERQNRPSAALTQYRIAVALSPRPEYASRLASIEARVEAAA